MQNLKDVSIGELLPDENVNKYCFFIPSYQRGYRWGSSEIKKLLNDLYEFYILAKKNNREELGQYYCLQPITFKRRKEDMHSDTAVLEIVDGQQRLTTIYLILKFVLRNPDDGNILIEYERDRNSNDSRKKYLQALKKDKDCELEKKTVDEHYFYDAFFIIKDWFRNKRVSDKTIENSMEQMLIEYTRVILYELEEDEDCFTVFKNLNNGKIPLTDAELVKAMLLNSKNFFSNNNVKLIEQKQDYYARFWDEMQNALNDKAMWSFITGDNDLEISNHIDLLLLLDINERFKNEEKSNQDYKVFNLYEEKLNEASNKEEFVRDLFDKIRALFRTVQSWFYNPQIYNFIGFRTTYEGMERNRVLNLIGGLLTQYNAKEHDLFIRKDLIRKILCTIDRNRRVDFESVNYEDNSKTTEKILMLFNILELNELSAKFNFDKKDSEWSVEHINAQHSKIVKDETDDSSKWKDFLKKEKERILIIEQTSKENHNALIHSIDDFIQGNMIRNAESFTALANRISKEIDGFTADDEHRLGNLALILKCDNSALSNDPFYEKRSKIFGWLDDSNKNIPFSTAKAFEKRYSPQDYHSNYVQWKKSDCEAMIRRQKELFNKLYIEDGKIPADEVEA